MSFKESPSVARILERIVADARKQILDDSPYEYGPELDDIYRQLFEFKKILDEYQEQPSILDPCLEKLLGILVNFLREVIDAGYQPSRKLLPCFSALYYFCKVRGYKTVVKFLTHEATDLEVTLSFLSKISTTIPEFWEMRYMSLLWLSLIVMIPFDLKVLDSACDNEDSIVTRIVKIGKGFLAFTGKEYEGAAILLTRLLTRKDTVDAHLPSFIDWCLNTASSASVDSSPKSIFLLRGTLYTLCSIYKLGPRTLLQQSLPAIANLCSIVSANSTLKNHSMIRKYSVKLSQRIGLCFLKPRVASWRYQRGCRTLVMNLKSPVISSKYEGISENISEEEIYVPEEIEEIVSQLLIGLRDPDTIVRWSSAKGIGRISSRLPQDFATEIISSVLYLFSEDMPAGVKDLAYASEHSWHGACLALAELIRRGLLVPEYLDKVVPWISMVLRNNLRLFNLISKEGHILLALKAYEPSLLVSHVLTLSTRLLVSATLDREVNIRRAASAAFQEGVGRLGGSDYAVPDGISIVMIADYFSLGNRATSITDIADVIYHVATVTAVHWDKAMRALAATALHKMTLISLEYVLEHILPIMIPNAFSSELAVRHGSCLCIAEIVKAWYIYRSSRLPANMAWWRENELDPLINTISDIVTSFPKPFLETSFGNDLTRIALCTLISRVCESDWPESSETRDFVDAAWNLLYSTLEHREEEAQTAAAYAVSSLSEYCLLNSEYAKTVCNLVEKIGSKLEYTKSTDPSQLGKNVHSGSIMHDRFPRRGYSSVPGKLSPQMIKIHGKSFIKALTKVIVSKDGGGEDAESRRNSLTSLVELLQKLPIQDFSCVFTFEIFVDYCEAFFWGMEDYSVDSRGDVGSLVRQAAFSSWVFLVPYSYEISKVYEFLDIEYIRSNSARAIKGLIRQSVEKIDRVRENAGKALMEIIWLENIDFGISDIAITFLRSILKKSNEINWTNSAEVYSRMVNLLVFPELRIDLLTGLVVSVGGASESLVKHSTASFTKFILSLPIDKEDGDSCCLIDILDGVSSLFNVQSSTLSRIIIPLLDMIDVIIGCGAISILTCKNLWSEELISLFELIKKQVSRSKDVKKCLAAIKVFVGLSSLTGKGSVEVRKRALKQLLMYLTYPYPRVRRESSEGLYLVLVNFTQDSYSNDVSGQIEELLLTTDWDAPVKDLKAARSRIEFLTGFE